MSKQPYLSIITSTRNDNYAGGSKERLEFSLRVLTEQLENAKIETEIIIVDWNQVKENKPIRNSINFPKNLKYCQIKVVEVPDKYHKKYKNWKTRHVHGSVAANVGFRRAQGKFLVLKVIDSFWSKELIDFIAKKSLEQRTLYRCDRKDVNINLLSIKGNSVDMLLNYCKKNVVHVHEKSNYQHTTGTFKIPILHTNACGDFQLLSKKDLYNLRGYHETKSANATNVDSTLSFCAFATGIKETELPKECCVYKIEHSNSYAKRYKEKPLLIETFIKSNKFVSEYRKNKLINLSHLVFGEPKQYISGIRIPNWDEYKKDVKKILTGKKSPVRNNKTWGLGNQKLKSFDI